MDDGSIKYFCSRLGRMSNVKIVNMNSIYIIYTTLLIIITFYRQSVKFK